MTITVTIPDEIPDTCFHCPLCSCTNFANAYHECLGLKTKGEFEESASLGTYPSSRMFRHENCPLLPWKRK